MHTLSLLKHRGSFGQSLISQLFAYLPRGVESMDTVGELVDGELEIFGDVPYPLLDNGGICGELCSRCLELLQYRSLRAVQKFGPDW